jgi:alkanesulfonate monooxygenase SsuD/methylene tetrahydromethanopterin reductase-like flavin-dependent oxidoreductase (luciferase family)
VTLAVGCLLNRFTPADGAGRRELVRLADEAGLDHFAVGDHVSFRTGVGFDGLVGAASVLTASDRLACNTAVYLLPLRHPVIVARQLADLASMADGRFVFGIGIGGEDPHEVAVSGVDPRTRGRRTDEAIQIVRGLLSGASVDFDGAHFQLQAARIEPAPATPIPIVVGGRSDAAIRRAGWFGDGWFGIWVSAGRYRQALDEIAQATTESGRTPPEELVNALNVWCGVGDDRGEARSSVALAMQQFYGMPFDRFERWCPSGSARDIADFLAPYVEAGCSLFNLILCGRSAQHEVDAAASVREHLRAL